MYRFELTNEEIDRVETWLKTEVYPKEVAWQQDTITDPNYEMAFCWEEGVPYEGAIGGGLTYEFTHTSLGVITVARYKSGRHTEYRLDLTDYASW